MKRDLWFIFWAVALIAAPVAAAEATIYPIPSTVLHQSEGITEPMAGEFYALEFVDQKFHDYTSLGYAWILEASITPSIIMADVGAWNFTVALDGVLIPGCFALLETTDFGGFLSAGLPVTPTFDLRCGLPGISPPEIPTAHNLTFSLIPQSGTPTEPDSISLSLTISREDYIMVPQDANEISEFVILFAPILVQLLFLVLLHREEHTVPAIMTGVLSVVVGVMAAVAMPEGFESMRIAIVGLIGYAAVKIAALSLSPQEA